MDKKDLKKFFIDHWLILGPMAGVNDIAFRQICIECGAQLTYTEMVSSKGLDYKNDKTQGLLRLANNENLVVVQIFGHEPDVMARQARAVSEKLGNKLAYIDINMGCPARKITKKGDGSALMDRPNLAAKIVKACSQVSTVTVKFRNHDNVYNFAEKMEKAGAAAMCVHPRFAHQFYKGKADWDIIKKVKRNSSIPIIGSGDVLSYKDAELRRIDCDAVMIARAARGNPNVFNDKSDSIKTRAALAKKHLVLYKDIYGNNLSHMRKHCMWYVKGLPGASFARDAFTKCVKLEEFLDVIERWENNERI